MTNAKTWQDIFYETTAEELVYSVRYLGNDIFYGRAVKSPSAATLRINISKICRDWVEAQVPSFNDGVYQGINYGVFDLVSDEGTVLSQYGFLFNWDYEDVWDGQSFVMSKPINGRADSRMIMLYSVFEDTTGQTICREEEFIKKLRIIPSYIEVSNTGVTRTITVESNYDYSVTVDDSWLHISPLSGTKGKTVFTLTVDENALAQERYGTIHFDDSILTVYQKAAPVTIEVNPTEFDFTSSASASTFVVSANTDYTVSADVPWITVSANSGGTGQTVFTFTIDENRGNGRNGHILINGKPRIDVSQERYSYFIVSPTALTSGYESDSRTIVIESNVDYNIVANVPWLHLSQDSGTSGITTITVVADRNGVETDRSGVITIGYVTVLVSQDRFVPYLEVEPLSLNFDFEGGSSAITITANTGYSVSIIGSWISTSQSAITSGISVMTVIASPNNDETDRSGSVSIGNKTITVQQGKLIPILEISENPLYFDYSGGTKQITITANFNYGITTDSEWLTLSTNSGYSGTTVLTITASGNEDYDIRETIIYVRNEPIYVYQYDSSQVDYLTFVILTGGSISYASSNKYYFLPTVEYQINGGEWNTIDITGATVISDGAFGKEIQVNAGDIVKWRGENSTYTQYGENPPDPPEPRNGAGFGLFARNSAKYKVCGNLMSLSYGDDYLNKEITDMRGGNFWFLFHNDNGLYQKDSGPVDAGGLILPNNLTRLCYAQMFGGCTHLKRTPIRMPATVMYEECYSRMFSGCTSLTSVPYTLPATTLEYACYYRMFESCTSLAKTPKLPALNLSGHCYNSMFTNCTGLTEITDLPATTLYEGCYCNMFDGCSSLVHPQKELPATSVKNSSYYCMFQNCTSLLEAPVIRATELEAYACYGMFKNCYALQKAPALLPSYIPSAAYASMFYGCSAINWAKCLATSKKTNGTELWFAYAGNGSGTFIKAAGSSWSTGNNGIPSGWTVIEE